MNGQLTLSVLQHTPTPLDIDASVRRLSKALSQAADDGSELLLVPEAGLTGYNVSPQQAGQIALTSDSTVHATLAHQCQACGTGLAYGYIERDGDHLYNAVAVLSDTGETIAHYRKTHLWGDLDRSLFQAGEDLSPVVSYRGWKLGLLICYDVEFPETVRRLALEGAEVLLIPTALMRPFDFVARHLVATRAAESQLFIAYANYCGSENDLHYTGQSCIVSPTGRTLTRAEEEAMLLSTTLQRRELETIRRELPYLIDRRPELYRALTDDGPIPASDGL